MKGKYKLLASAAMAMLVLAACGDEDTTKVSNELELSQETKMVVDELNREDRKSVV